MSNLGEIPFSDADIARFNREHDARYGFRLSEPNAGYARRAPLPRLFGPPDLDKTLPDRILDRLVWAHHLEVVGL